MAAEKEKKPLIVRCPTCKKKGPWFDGPYGPFCSERCKMIDLGRWLGEEYRISEPLPGQLPTSAEEEEALAEPESQSRLFSSKSEEEEPA